MLYYDQYHVPETLDEAFDLIHTNGGNYKVLAGQQTCCHGHEKDEVET